MMIQRAAAASQIATTKPDAAHRRAASRRNSRVPSFSDTLASLQVFDLGHHFTGEKSKRAQRIVECHDAEEEIAEQIVYFEFGGLPLDFGANRIGRAGNCHAVLLPVLERNAAGHEPA